MESGRHLQCTDGNTESDFPDFPQRGNRERDSAVSVAKMTMNRAVLSNMKKNKLRQI